MRCGLRGATLDISNRSVSVSNVIVRDSRHIKPFSQCEQRDSAQGWAARFKRCIYLELLYGRLRGRDVCACVKL